MKKDNSFIYNYLAGILFAATSVLNFIDKDISFGIIFFLLGIVFVAEGFKEQKKRRNNMTE